MVELRHRTRWIRAAAGLALALGTACGRVDFDVRDPLAPSCSPGQDCAVLACSPGTADCDGDPVNGCEAHLGQDATCGNCGTRCLCDAGACSGAFSCNPGYADCNGLASDGCETKLSSMVACGVCGRACSNANGTTACVDGTCVPVCNEGFGDCDKNPSNGCETNIYDGDYFNCGACGQSCSGPTVCRAGQCY